MVDAILNWFEFGFPGPEMREIYWLFPTAEALHFVGICLLFGSLGFIDLRLLGYFNRLSLKSVLAYLPVVGFGFVVCLVTGWMFFSDNPGIYIGNPAFVAKMALILVAGANALWFTIVIHPKVSSLGPGQDASPAAKASAGASLGLWLAVLLLGRLLPLFGAST